MLLLSKIVIYDTQVITFEKLQDMPDSRTFTIRYRAKQQNNQVIYVDEVTGKVVYTDWTTSEFEVYDLPSIPGYTSNISSVEAEKVTVDTKDRTVVITFKQNVKVKSDETPKQEVSSRTNSAPDATTAKKQTTLPQTGEQHNSATTVAVVVATMMAMALSGIEVFRKKKNS